MCCQTQKEELTLKKTKSYVKRALALLVMLALLVSVGVMGASAATVSSAEISADATSDVRTIYFSPNGYWNNLFAVYAWSDNKDNGEWKALSKVDSVEGLYSVELSTAYTNAVFCSRIIPAFSWDSVDDKTDELELSEEYNYLSLAGETTALWGHYNAGDASVNPAESQKIYFSPCADWVDIQYYMYHSFVVHAYNASDAEGMWTELTLVEGEIGVYPAVWMAEIPSKYDTVEFCRVESGVENGWFVWEKTEEQIIPSDSNRFSQYIDAVTGTWDYYVEPEVNPDAPGTDEPEDPTPDTPVVPGATKTIYFSPNSEWTAYATDSTGKITAAYWCGDGAQTWVWAENIGDGVYTVEISEEATNIIFGISFGATADVSWAKTDAQTIPGIGNHFTQNPEDTATGTWGIYKDSVSGVYYSVAFVNWDNTLLSAQAVLMGSSAQAPENPTRAGYTFKGWDTAFDVVTSDIIVKAEYEKNATTPVEPTVTGTLKVEVSGGTSFTISMGDGAARPQGATYTNTKAPVGIDVTLTVADNGRAFIGWINPANGQILSTDLTYTFVTSGNDFVKATFATDVDGVQMVTFKNDKAGTYGRVLDSQYYASEDAITFPDDPTQVGFDFAGWSMTEAEIQTAIAKGEDVTVLATWTRQLVYVNVTVSGGTGGGKVLANSAVTVTANAAPAGQKFAYWTDADGNIKSYSTEYKFFPAADTTVTAVFVDEDAEVEQQILISLDYIDYAAQAAANKAVFGYSWYLPSEYTIVKAGLVAVNKDNYNEETLVVGSSDSNVYDRSSSQIIPTGTGTWTKSNVFEGQTWVAKAYVQYKDAEDTLITVYSDLIEAEKTD